MNVKKLLRTVEHKRYYHCAIALPAKVVEFLNAQPTHSMRAECSTTSYPSTPDCLKGLFRVPLLLPGFNLLSTVFVTPLPLNFLLFSDAPFCQRFWILCSLSNPLLPIIFRVVAFFFPYCHFLVVCSVYSQHKNTTKSRKTRNSTWIIRGGGGITRTLKVKMHGSNLWDQHS